MDVRASRGPRRGPSAVAGGLRLVDPPDADFETMSGIALEPVYGPADWPEDQVAPSAWAGPAVPPTPGDRTPRCTARSSGRCGCSPGSAPPRTPTSASASSCGPASGGLSVAFDLPTLMGRDSDDPLTEGEVGRCGVAVDTLADAEDLFAGIDLGAVTTSMTINSPAPILHGHVRGGGREAPAWPRRRPRRHAPERHPEGVPGPEGVHLPAAALDAPRRRRGPVLRGGDAAGSIPCRCRATTSARPARRPPRSSPSPSPTGSPTSRPSLAAGLAVDEFAPRLSFFFNAHLDFFEEIAKYRAARRIWARWMADRYGAHIAAVAAAAVPHPDRRRLAHGPAARGQHRPHRHRGAGRRARRDPEPAHQFDGRGAGAPHREGGPHRAAHPAGHRPRDRGDERGRPPRWLVVRRVAHRRDRAPGRGGLRPPRRVGRGLDARRRARTGSRTTGSRARSPTPPTCSSARWPPAGASWSG